MLRADYPLYLAGRATTTGVDLPVLNKHTGKQAARVAVADEAIVRTAIAAASEAFERTRRMPAHRRRDVLNHVARRCEARAEELARVLAIEVGKPIRDARGEVTRLIDTLRISAEEATRIVGEYAPLDVTARGEGFESLVKRVPIGPCGFITPFNFPLNLAAHKIGPAIAVGCPWVLKPASATPVSALILGEMLAETDLPPGAFSILPCSSTAIRPLITDERIRKLSFTGSPEVGWRLRGEAGRKAVTLELGGNAPCIVDDDANLELAAARITFGAFYQSGQSCVSVQRVLVHRRIYEDLRGRLLARAEKLRCGDPLDETTDLGPLISEEDAIRLEQWVEQARAAGARVLCGGRRSGAHFPATYVEDVPHALPLDCQEAFGPVATLRAFDDFGEAIAAANASEFGLQAGVFTRKLDYAWRALGELEYGGVIVNDVPSMRIDSMPYGGVKGSGVGREGVRYAIESMTERRLLVWRTAGVYETEPR